MVMTIEVAKRRLLLNELARRLGIAGEIPEVDGKLVSCWWRDRHANGDRKPSLNLYEGLTRFRCFGCGIAGDGPDLITTLLGVSKEEGFRRFLEMASGKPQREPSFQERKKAICLPSDLTKGTQKEWRLLAKLRMLEVRAVNLAVEHGVLRFGTICGTQCWIVLDGSTSVAEARRLDGKPFPAFGRLLGRKAHTIAGSDKSWPVGIRISHSNSDFFRKIVLVEGGPDLLAAYHFNYVLHKMDALPVAMLGRECRTIHPRALPLFRGRDVRVMPHADEDGGGMDAAKRWAKQIEEAGATSVTAFNFSELIRKDGEPVSDLNDCTVIRSEDGPELERLLE